MRTPVASRGFTLMEMLVVLVLMSIAVGLAGFGLQQGLSTASERRAVGDMVEALAGHQSARDCHRSAGAHRIQSAQGDLQGARQARDALAGKSARDHADRVRSWFRCGVLPGRRAPAVAMWWSLTATGRWRIDIGWLAGSVQVRTL
ncbi:general secretion pathway protein H [Pseudomonas syringae pv. pisi str. 1704B]|uniref:General secretion pathway protein H n=1 Tax=Pseudomonas syringae pv. pisi str. 1704B TaxID=629263 RepID=F3G8I1_PSESJ|nr:general secretion pathway protein H [Pseudomonas syringae pv. pisi str. 1704B]